MTDELSGTAARATTVETASLADSATEFCIREAERTRISDWDLFPLAAERSGLFLPEGKFAIPVILQRIEKALREGTGLALIRVGDGEGAALGMIRPEPNPIVSASFHDYFDLQNNCPLPMPDSVAFCKELGASLQMADIIGFRAFRKDENALIERAIRDGARRSPLGFIYAREMLVDLLKTGLMRDKLLTTAWIHLELIPYIENMLSMTEKVVVISGRPQLVRGFRKRLKGRSFEFIEVPPEAGEPCELDSSHFHLMFPKVKQALSKDLRGTLVLVGAGMFGKIYCAGVKKSGGVAVDMGSAFDLLSGLITRPVFAQFKFDLPAWA
ncbi:MAG TPA: hypothetical protein VIJ94_07340 [Caulobacteraceae bacterium]